MNVRRVKLPVPMVIIAVLVAAVATNHGLMAQDKAQQPTITEVKPPAAAQQQAQQPPAGVQGAKPEMGPPIPTAGEPRLVTMPLSDIKKGQPAAHPGTVPGTPQSTVQLKPGEVPGIKFDTADYDFGKIPAGQDVTHDFWFTNTGNGPLEILSAKPS